MLILTERFNCVECLFVPSSLSSHYDVNEIHCDGNSLRLNVDCLLHDCNDALNVHV